MFCISYAFKRVLSSMKEYVGIFFYWFMIVFPCYLYYCLGFQALIQYQSRQSSVAARTTLQVLSIPSFLVRTGALCKGL